MKKNSTISQNSDENVPKDLGTCTKQVNPWMLLVHLMSMQVIHFWTTIDWKQPIAYYKRCKNFGIQDNFISLKSSKKEIFKC